MDSALAHLPDLPPQQEAIRAKCFHPTGVFVESTEDDLEQPVCDLFERMVFAHADRLAVRSRRIELTYGELNRAANRVARAILEQKGYGQEPIALLFEQGAALLAPMLGVLKAGKFFVPLDADYPVARTRYMVEDAGAGLILTNVKNLAFANELAGAAVQVLNVDEVDATLSDENLGLSISPDALCFVLYTSGSTGQPKGVIRNHRNTLHNSMIRSNTFHICPDDRLSLLASVSGQAITNIFLGLLTGAALFPFDVKAEGVAPLGEWLMQQKITLCWSAASLFRHFIETLPDEQQFPSMRLVRLSSQTVFPRDAELFKRHFPEDCILVNGLSSTETNIQRLFYIDKSTQFTTSSIPVGYPADPDQENYLLDEDGNEVSPGEVGEIVVRSRYLFRGYWRRPELTQEVLKPDPGGGDKAVFHTGDLGRMQSDGCLEHLGRKDAQLKVRGNRVEPAEVEGVLLGLEGVNEAVVVAREDRPGQQRLVAYLVPDKLPAPTVTGIRRALAERLPSYMVPSVFVVLETLPQAPNGKVLRSALPAPGQGRPELESAYEEPRTSTEEELARIWAETLGVDRVGVQDNFVDLGGHSLLAMQLVSRVVKAFGVELSLRSLLEAPTVAAMAEVIDRRRASDSQPQEEESPLVALQTGGERAPLFCCAVSNLQIFGFGLLSQALGEEQPFYVLRPPARPSGRDKWKVEEVAERYLEEIRAVQPRGPYHLCGFCGAGRVAYEMAQRLVKDGQEVGLVAFMDTPYTGEGVVEWARLQGRRWADRWRQFGVQMRDGVMGRSQGQGSRLRQVGKAAKRLVAAGPDHGGEVSWRYNPQPYPGRIVQFLSTGVGTHSRLRWEGLAGDGVEVHQLAEATVSMLRDPHVSTLAEWISSYLGAAPQGVKL